MTEKGTAFATTSDEDDATGRAAEVQADAAVAETSLNVLKSKVFGMKRFRDYIYVQKNDFEEANYGNAFSATFVSKRAGRNELPARTLEVLNLPNCPTDLISVRSETKQFAPVTMFCERGGYSGHVYQLLVNHRMMRFCNFTETHVVGDRPPNPPLINSMIHPTPKCSFSVGNFISLYAYEIVESDDEMLPRIYSPASLSLMNEDANVNLLSTSTIKGYRARPISVDGWLRVLDVFGFDRNPHFPQDHVSANEIASFLEKLGTYDLSSIEGLANFVRDCHMQWLYDVTEDPLPDQLNSFFSLVRGVMPMRLAAYDGRHRFSLCCYFSTGYFRPTPDVVMLRKSFDDMDFQVYEDDEPSFKRCAVFHPQVFILSQAEPALQQPMLDLKIVMKNLYKSGAHTTANQNLSVEASWSTVIPEFIEYLRMGQVESQLRTYDFDTFWEPPSNLGPLKDPSGREPNTVSKNTEALFTAFREFVDLAKETREALVIGDSKQKLSAVFTTLDPANKNKVYTLDMGKAREPKPPPGVPRDLGTFLSILKLCSDDMESIVRLRDLMELRPSRFKQVEWKEDAKSYFRSMTFLRYWVWGTSNLVTQHLVQRYIVDKAVIKYLLEAKGDAGLTSDLASIDIEPLTYPMAEAGGLFKNIKVTLAAGKKNSRKVGDDCGVWVDPDFQLPRYSSKLTQKLTFACQAVIFRDIVKAIVEYGQNPKFELNGNCNHMLHLYISGFDFFEEDIKSFTNVPGTGQSLHRNALLALLELYKEYVFGIVPLDKMAVMGLGNMMPLTSDLNRGGKKVQSGYKHDGAVFPCQSQMTGLDSIVQPSWLFSNFLKGVQEGTVNVDVIPSFKKHMSEPFAKMLATHKGLVAEPGNVVHGSFLENYSPPVIPKAPRNTGGTQKTDKGATAFMQIVQGMYSFDGKRTVKEAYVLHEDVSHKALGKFFENLLEEGAVKSVSFHPERLKDLYVTEKTPNDAAGFLVMNHIDKIERASNKKPRAPGKDTPPRSKRPRRTGDHSKSPNSKNSKDRR